MLSKLLAATNRTGFTAEVVSLTNIGPVGEAIRSLGVPVRALGMRRGVPNPVAVIRLAWWINQTRPEVIQTWMYHANLIGGIAARLVGDIPVAWGIRQSHLDPGRTKRRTLWTAKVGARLSRRVPQYIVCCSQASLPLHESLGYAAEKMIVIPNGFDLDLYSPDAQARASVREELRIPDSALVIGLVARFDPHKDHRNFILAAGRLSGVVKNVSFLLCGEGATWDNTELSGWIDEVGLRRWFHLVGQRSDVPRITAALDIASSSSCGEGFPNVIGEAMACSVPCVVTDVGDSGFIVGETGRVVPPRDPAALAAAWEELIEQGKDGRRALGSAARRRIAEHFSVSAIARSYETLYRDMARSCAE